MRLGMVGADLANVFTDCKINLLPCFMSNSPTDPKISADLCSLYDGQEVTNLGLELGQSETNKGVL